MTAWSTFNNFPQRSAGSNSAFSGHFVFKRLQKPLENGLNPLIGQLDKCMSTGGGGQFGAEHFGE